MDIIDVSVGSELRVPPKWAIAMLAVAGLALVVVGEFWLDVDAQYQALRLAMLIHIVSVAAWLLSDRAPRVSIWLAISVSFVAIFLGAEWMGIAGFLCLVPVPVILAAGLSGLPAALLVTIVETAAVILLQGPAAVGPQPLATAGVSVAALWIVLGSMYAVYRPVYQLGTWLEQYFHRVQLLLEEARDHRARLEHLTASLAHANRQLALANERAAMLRDIAEQAQRAKTAFVSSVSHEFRTPLNMIIGLVDLMMRSPGQYDVVLSPKMRADFEVVHRNCLHLADMVNDVLDLTRTEADRLTLRREAVDLKSLAEESAAVVRPLLDEKGLSLRIAAPDDLPAVHCDRTRTRQIILNLLSNAARYTDAGGVTVELASYDQQVLVCVTDTGEGIPQDDVERIFEPFWQGSGRNRPAKGGSGLGLSISRDLVRRHGGRMWVESRIGRGTSFYFTLPVCRPAENGVRARHRIKEDWPWREPAFRTDLAVPVDRLVRPRLLCWDETGELMSLAARYSDEVEFVRVQDLTQLTGTLDECAAHAVVLNVARPGDVWPTTERARRETRGTPVLGCCLPKRVQRGSDLGVLGHLIKPVTFSSLQQALGAIQRPVRRVLVVDDDPDVLRLFGRMLDLYDETLEVTSVATGAAALDAVRRAAPDLMLLDIVMPDMDGWQVLEALARERTGQIVPVLLVSAQDPAEQAAVSELILATVTGGLPVGKVLSCSLALSRLLVAPERQRDLAPL